jgi:FkbM family methyltransferase
MPHLHALHELLRRFATGTLETDTSKFADLGKAPLFLYGAGNMGKKLYHQLAANNVAIAGFLDRNPHIELENISVPVHRPDDPALSEIRGRCTVVLSGLFPLRVCNEIKTRLHELGFCNVYALHEVNFHPLNGESIQKLIFDDAHKKTESIEKYREKLEQAFSLLAGEADRSLFLSLLEANLTMDFTRLPAPQDISLQYLGQDIPERIDFSRFVDCGGYDGDSFRQITAQGHSIKTLVAFEPQADLLRSYASSLEASASPPDEAFLYPCGVYSETTQLRFSANKDAPSSARLNAAGDIVIQCVRLDEVLHGTSPTLIKMDIEGAETAALRGAEKIIRQQGPGLAICVYHRFSDLWEVPNLIHGMRDDYRYYLRNYNFLGLETVLYALRSNAR